MTLYYLQIQELQAAKGRVVEMEAELIKQKQVAATATGKVAEISTAMTTVKRELSGWQKENRQVKTE